jgi:hypothetical protein
VTIEITTKAKATSNRALPPNREPLLPEYLELRKLVILILINNLCYFYKGHEVQELNFMA